jgi:hypothetical protein
LAHQAGFLLKSTAVHFAIIAVCNEKGRPRMDGLKL